MKRKLFAVVLAVVMIVSVVAVLASCTKYPTPEEVKAAVEAASNMDLAALEAAAEAEFKAAGLKFTAQATTSGVGKVLTKFKEKYAWFDYNDFSSSKDKVASDAINSTLANNNYYADFTMIQIAENIQTWVDAGYLYNYVPKNDDQIQLNAAATQPLVGLYADKLFAYKKSATTVTLTNIWQLTNVTGASLQKVKGSSIQDPNNEGINMAFMIMLTSPEACTKLAAAYKSYTGNDYTAQTGCANIGYYFIQEYIAALTTLHGSDSKVLSETLETDTTGTVFVVGLNKTKGYSGENWHEDLFYSGVDGDVEGYNGFTYNTYLNVPKTSRLPYTACLFARYILTSDGFKAGWKDVGYSSPNAKVAPNTDSGANFTYKLDVNKVLQENGQYTAEHGDDVKMFVASKLASK
ncbi:MAG: hypothetical protein NC332_00160 [Firmicutes bacterium]|nr:hypothetical protein [Bacillota bacterium]